MPNISSKVSSIDILCQLSFTTAFLEFLLIVLCFGAPLRRLSGSAIAERIPAISHRL